MEVTDLMNCPVTLCDSPEKIDSPVHSDDEESSSLDDTELVEDVDQLRSDFDQLPTFINMENSSSLLSLGLLSLLLWFLGMDGNEIDPRSVEHIKFEKSIMMILFGNGQIESCRLHPVMSAEVLGMLVTPVIVCTFSILAMIILISGYIVFTLLYLIYTSPWLSITAVTFGGSYLVYRLVRR